jgi:hypothetical protein
MVIKQALMVSLTNKGTFTGLPVKPVKVPLLGRLVSRHDGHRVI